MEPAITEPTRKKKRTFKEKTLDSLKGRLAFCKQRLGNYSDLVNEIKELEKAILSLDSSAVLPSSDITQTVTLNKEDLYDRPGDVTPLSDKGVAIYNSLPLQFRVETVATRLDNNLAKAYQYIAAWKRSMMLKTVSRGVYEKINSNGK